MITKKLKIVAHCPSCFTAIEGFLKKSGIEVKPNITLGFIKVTFDEDKIDLKDVISKIAEAGYEAYE